MVSICSLLIGCYFALRFFLQALCFFSFIVQPACPISVHCGYLEKKVMKITKMNVPGLGILLLAFSGIIITSVLNLL